MDMETAAALGIVDTGAPAEAFAEGRRIGRRNPGAGYRPARAERNPDITQMEVAPTEYMEARITADTFHWSERVEDSHRYKCNACGLVWEKKWHAETCGSRGHKTFFTQTYGIRYIENGVPKGNPVTYTRSAVRREPVAK